MKVWTEIAAERLAGNFLTLSSLLGNSEADPIALLAVVKADAYGHGIDPCAWVLACAGAKWLGVTDASEGALVRLSLEAYGIARALQPGILVMSGPLGLEGEAECIVQNRLSPVIWELDHVKHLAAAARALRAEEPLQVHLEVDTGMSRQGVVPGAALEAVLRQIAAEPRLALNGVMTHFASTEVANSAQTKAQQTSFEAALAQVAALGLNPQWVHVGNSSYIDNATPGTDSLNWLRLISHQVGAQPMVRSGLALYGYLLPIEGPADRQGQSLAGAMVHQVMTWKTRIIAVRELPAGALVGYNGTFAAEHPMCLALLPVGYADGLRRELSSTNSRAGGWVMVRGERAPIVGRVSMNLTTVDVTAIPGVATGDEVVLLGQGVSADDHARLAGTIAYEIVCGVRTSP